MELFTTFPPILLVLSSLYLFFFQSTLSPQGALSLSVAALLFTFLATLFNLTGLLSGNEVLIFEFGRWFFCLNLIDSHFIFIMDTLSVIMALLVLFLTPLALIFGAEYMYREFQIYKLLTLLNFFAVSVVFLFFVYDFFLLLLAWEGIGLFSLLLVNFYSIRVYTIKAALKTYFLSRVSDMFIFLAFLLLTLTFQTTDFSLIFIQAPFLAFYYLFCGMFSLHLLSLIISCLALGGLIKSAQFFFHVWLPDAMEAPTPASALIHSSTLVIAGIFLMFRFSLFFEFCPQVAVGVAIYGAITLVFAALTACVQQDIKKLVAYSTISQIGYLVCGCGLLAFEETLLYLIIHALNKALLFILVGYLVHFYLGNTDLRFMGASWILFADFIYLLLGLGLNLSGLPYFAGFISKELLLNQVFLTKTFATSLVQCAWLLSFFLTPFYMLTPLRLILFSTRRFHLPLSYSLTLPQPLTLKFRSFYYTTALTGPLTLYLYSLVFILIITWGDLLYLTLNTILGPEFIFNGETFGSVTNGLNYSLLGSAFLPSFLFKIVFFASLVLAINLFTRLNSVVSVFTLVLLLV